MSPSPILSAPAPLRQRAVALAAATLAAVLASATHLAAAQPAPASDATALVAFDIPVQPLEQAVPLWARQAGVQLMVPPALLSGAQGRAVQGRLTSSAALSRLLQGSGLVGRFDGATVVIERPVAGRAALPAITVTAFGEATADGPVPGYLARRTATATKTDTPVLEVPQSISIIGRQEMEARGSQDVMDVVRYTPGVTTSTFGPDNRSWEYILLRGFETGVTGVYRDGLGQPAFLPTYYLTEPYGLERVEVMRGPSSVLFGKGDAGGIVNRVSKQPGERVREIELQYGSFQRQQLAFDLGDAVGGDTGLSYRLIGLGLDSNDQDRYPDGRKLNHTRTYLAPSVRWQPGGTTSLTVFGEFLRNNTGEDPYYLTQDYRLYPVKVGDPSFGQLKQTSSAIGYRFETALNDRWTLRQNLRYSRISMSRRVVWADGLADDGRTLSRVARTWDNPVNLAAIDTHVQGQLQHGEIGHTVLLGVDHSDQRGTQRRFIGPAPELDVLAPVYGQAVTLPTEPMTLLDQATRQTGIYAQDQVKLGQRWVLTLGGRHDEVRQSTDDYLNTSRTRNSDRAFSSRVGLSHLLGNGWAPYVSHVTSFLPNSGVDANSEPFKPSRGKQVEVGIKFQPEGTRTLFTAAAYDLRKTHVVTYDPATGEGRQVGKQRSRGIELEAKGEIAPGLNIAAAYTWLDMKVLDSADPDEVGKIPPLVPRQSASLWLDYALGHGLGLGGGVRYVGKRQNDEYNTTFERGVTVFDAAVRYDRGPWRLALNVSNLANRKYNAICYHGECYQGSLRAATLSARYSF